MNTVLIVLLALTIFVTLCDAFCIHTPLELDIGVPLTGCKDNNDKMHKFNTEWDKKCMHCLCREGIGIICCNIILRPMLYDREKCREIFNQKKCSYVAVEKKNPSELCEVAYFLG